MGLMAGCSGADDGEQSEDTSSDGTSALSDFSPDAVLTLAPDYPGSYIGGTHKFAVTVPKHHGLHLHLSTRGTKVTVRNNTDRSKKGPYDINGEVSLHFLNQGTAKKLTIEVKFPEDSNPSFQGQLRYPFEYSLSNLTSFNGKRESLQKSLIRCATTGRKSCQRGVHGSPLFNQIVWNVL